MYPHTRMLSLVWSVCEFGLVLLSLRYYRLKVQSILFILKLVVWILSSNWMHNYSSGLIINVFQVVHNPDCHGKSVILYST
jgi:hypothetical protein